MRVRPPFELRMGRRRRLALVGEGALVGIAGGAVVAAYRWSLANAERLLRLITGWLADRPPLQVAWFAVLAVLLLVVGRLMLWEPFTQGSGIPQVDAEVAGRIDMPWRRVLPVKFAEGVLCALAGLSLGREGPSVQLGGMAGKGVSRLLRRGRTDERLLVTCGAAAGMSAAFHAPLAGVLFAVEEIHKEFSAALVISAMTCSVVADLVASQLLGITPVVHFVQYSELPHMVYPLVLPLGVLCGVLGVLHNRGMFLMQDRVFGARVFRTPYARIAVPFALAGVVAFVMPELMCGGDAVLELAMEPQSRTVLSLLGLLAAKYLFTAICFGSGAPGGTLFPLVVMGALFGAAYGLAAGAWVGVPGIYENSFIVLGIAGMFASVIQAPVTAVVLVFELTGSLEALLATAAVSILSYVTAGLLGGEPFYEHLYARLIGTATATEDDGEADEKLLRTFVVGAGSAVDGAAIRDVEWPHGMLVVTVRRAGNDVVAHGDTVLSALDELVVVMGSSQEVECVDALHLLCKPGA